MKLALLVLVLAFGWAATTGSYSGLNLLLGAVFAFIAIFLLRRSYARPGALRKVRIAALLLLVFLRELMLSAIRVGVLVLTPNLKSTLRPAIIAYPLKVQSDMEITILANMITLTPGTLSVDISADRKVLYMHVLKLESREAQIAEVANGFEARIRKLYA